MRDQRLISLTGEEQQRLTKILGLDLDAAQSGFSLRLSKEQGWDSAFTSQAIVEYKRFVFLSTICKHKVTPSKIVDQVWHLHLIYTHSYWTDLCEGILLRPFHHEPATLAPKDISKYRDLYRETLASYEKVFGEAAPQKFWPLRKMKQPTLSRKRRVIAPVLVALAAMCLLLSMLGLPNIDNFVNPLEMNGKDFLLFYTLLSGGVVISCCLILLTMMLGGTEENPRHYKCLNLFAIATFSTVIIIGLIKIWIGLSHGRDVEFLSMLVIGNGFGGYFFGKLHGPGSFRTGTANCSGGGCDGDGGGGGCGGGGCGGCGG